MKVQIENYRSDIEELNALLLVVTRQDIKEVIQENVSLLTAKIESLIDLTTKAMENKLDSTMVSNDKKKATSKSITKEVGPIPVITN
jgi:hypothetical protein